MAAADLDARRGALARDRQASEAVGEAEDELAERQRVAVGVYTAAWAERARALEVEAQECEEAETVPVTRYGRAGVREPVRAFKRDKLAHDAAGAGAGRPTGWPRSRRGGGSPASSVGGSWSPSRTMRRWSAGRR